IDATASPTYWKSRDITVEDILIVQLGDSYSSGEGAPDRTAADGYWGDDGTGANGAHAAAHRSSYTWGSVYAQQLQQIGSLLNNSVTYVNLAQTGAVINDVDDQLNHMATLIGPRKVDMLLISIGGNDAGLSNAIAAYLVREPVQVLFGTVVIGPG